MTGFIQLQFASLGNGLPETAVQWLAELACYSTIFLVLAGTTNWMIRRRSAAIRHRIWLLAFCGIALLPAGLMCSPLWPVRLLPSPVAHESRLSNSDTEVWNPVWNASEGLSGDVSEQFPPVEDARDEDGAKLHSATDVSEEQELAADPTPVNQNQSNPAGFTSVGQARGAMAKKTGSPSLAMFLVGGWLIGVIGSLTGVVLAHLRNRRLSRQATPVKDDNWNHLLTRCCDELAIARPVKLLASSRCLVPMTWGHWEPVIVIPDEAIRWPIARCRAVLVHELAHVKRADVLVQTFARLICALLWCHPLVWIALRQLRAEREVASDDCVITSGEKPTDYAEHLVYIARMFRGKQNVLNAAMATSSSLNARMESLLDSTRSRLPVSRRLTQTSILLLLTLVFLMSSVRLAHQVAASDDSPGSLVAAATQHSPTRLSGSVTTPNGDLVEGAEVFVVFTRVWHRGWEQTHEVIGSVSTNGEGQFQFDVPAAFMQKLGDRGSHWTSLKVVAIQKGFAPQWKTALALHTSSPLNDIRLRLAADDMPIRGRIIDEEGNPVAGVDVRTHRISRTVDNYELDPWIARARRNPATSQGMEDEEDPREVSYFPSTEILNTQGFPGLDKSTVTNANGEFTIEGLGPDRMVVLEWTASGYARNRISAVTCDVESFPYPTGDPRFGTQICYGSSFESVAEHDLKIRGVIRDSESGEPVAGVKIEASTFGSERLHVYGFLETTSDENGEYLLEGIPFPGLDDPPVALDFTPLPSQPYFPLKGVQVAKTQGLEPGELEVEFQKAVWVTGKLVNRETGEPVQGAVDFTPYHSNQYAKDYPNFDLGSFSLEPPATPTRAHGSFLIPVIPGKGVIAAVADDAGKYQLGKGAKEANLPENFEGPLLMYRLFMSGSVNTAIVVDIPENGVADEIEIGLEPLSRRTLHLVDSDGNQIVGARVVGTTPPSQLTHQEFLETAPAIPADEVDVLGLTDSFNRLLLFYYPPDNIGIALEIGKESPDEIVLQPCGKIVGQIRGMENVRQPYVTLTVAVPRSAVPESDHFSWFLPARRIFKANISKDGSFEVNGVLPGTVYEVKINNRSFAVGEGGKVFQPGETIDMGILDVVASDNTESDSTGQ